MSACPHPRHILAAAALLLASHAHADHVKVFILAGQSNMEGHGVVSMDGGKDYNGGKGNLVWSMEHSKSAGRMKRLKDEHGEWVVRDDVQISFKVGDNVRKCGRRSESRMIWAV
jgi:hypothetical protein